jgi:hypothetical protein
MDCNCNNTVDTIEDFDIVEGNVNSSFNIFLGKRRSGKSFLCEYFINQLQDEGLCDMVFVFSDTGAGFESVDKDNKFNDISILNNIVENFRKMNKYNSVVSQKEKIKLKVWVVIDDMAVKLKSKEFNILEELSVNGRHVAYDPLSLSFCILSQSLTKISRCCRLNCDRIFLNSIASSHERDMVLDENFYLIKSDREGKKQGRQLFHDLVSSAPFQFIVIENHKQNITEYKDYLKKYKAVVKK